MSDQIPYGGFGGADLDPGNVEPRVACVLVLDVSGSMSGRRIDELNKGLVILKDTLASDSLARKRAEVAIITFGQAVELQTPFTSAEYFEPPTLEVGGYTPMGEAINRAIDLVAERKQVYKQVGVPYYRPWIFLITDGGPTDAWQGAANRVRQGEREKAFVFFAVGVEDAEMDTLRAISTAQQPLKLQGVNFRDLFLWLSASMRVVSETTPGGMLTLPAPTWGTITS